MLRKVQNCLRTLQFVVPYICPYISSVSLLNTGYIFHKVSIKSINFCNFMKIENFAYSWSIANITRFVSLSSFIVDWKTCFLNFNFENFLSHEATNSLWAAVALNIRISLAKINKNSISQYFQKNLNTIKTPNAHTDWQNGTNSNYAFVFLQTLGSLLISLFVSDLLFKCKNMHHHRVGRSKSYPKHA